tara:strand:- start:4353 stop:5546 length:1194 start_codon:yes stop_codon:yes gene_type:complete
MSNNKDFIKIIDDFVKDLTMSFPELQDKFKMIDYDEYYNHCKNIYPENFFNILYQNDELFENDENKFLLPEVNFKNLLFDNKLSDNSKKTIWKYLQLILFCLCKDVNNKNEFGDTSKLFEAISEDDLHLKISETMDEMKNIFMNISNDNSSNDIDIDSSYVNIFENAMGDISNVESMFNEDMFKNMSGTDGSGSDGSGGDFFNPDDLKDHLSSLMNGKIGTLAKEIALDASKELGIDQDMSEEDQTNFLQNMFKNPSKMMNIVKKISNKLDDKFKTGDMKESELLDEAQDIMSKMKDMPGLKEMMASMGMNPNGKFDMKGMANKMQQNMKHTKMKERMQEKLNKNTKERLQEENEDTLKQVNEDTFVWTDENSDGKTPLRSKKKNKKKKNKKRIKPE